MCLFTPCCLCLTIQIRPDYLDFLATKKASPPPPVSQNTGHRIEVDLLADDTYHPTNYHFREERGRYNTEGITDRYDAFDRARETAMATYIGSRAYRARII